MGSKPDQQVQPNCPLPQPSAAPLSASLLTEKGLQLEAFEGAGKNDENK